MSDFVFFNLSHNYDSSHAEFFVENYLNVFQSIDMTNTALFWLFVFTSFLAIIGNLSSQVKKTGGQKFDKVMISTLTSVAPELCSNRTE
jgi:hypothetical protein